MNLREIRASQGYSQKEFAEKMGIAPSTYNQYESGKRQPDIETLKLIAKELNVSIDELVAEADTTPKSTGGVWIPVLGKVAAGVPIMAVEDVVDYEEISLELASRGEYFALRVEGDSMEPKISNGDVVIVRQQPDVESGEIAVVMINGDEAMVKKVIKQKTGIAIISSNPAYEPRYYSNEDIEQLPVRIVGKVVELRAKF